MPSIIDNIECFYTEFSCDLFKRFFIDELFIFESISLLLTYFLLIFLLTRFVVLDFFAFFLFYYRLLVFLDFNCLLLVDFLDFYRLLLFTSTSFLIFDLLFLLLLFLVLLLFYWLKLGWTFRLFVTINRLKLTVKLKDY